jgi:hypothetical protein
MRADILDEPELEFGGGNRHVDPRFGILDYGPADLGVADAPRAIRVGVVAPPDQVEGLRRWFERCREPIAAKGETYPHLFPAFPGCDVDVGLHTTLVFSERNTREISGRDIRLIERANAAESLAVGVDVYAKEILALADQQRVDVIVVGRPPQVRDTATRRASPPRPQSAPGPNGAHRGDEKFDSRNFHDLLKARVLAIRQPIQIVRRSTWDEATPPPGGRSRQDEATRAWNLHVALYYKAGGVPWRLRRDATDLTSCYVGVSFFRNIESDSLDTAVAQIFNERGDGVIVRGGAARISSDDLQPHLESDDARALLANALEVYRQEHHTQPARVVLHKSSSFTAGEAAGFQGAAEDARLEVLELTWITNSEGARLFRRGEAPPLRGTLLVIDDDEAALYTRGSTEFYATYPGMYIPRPLGIRPVGHRRSPEEQGRELLALTKMNWNVTRLDGREPVTLRTAKQVKAVLRFCTPDQFIASRYAHYM